MGLSSFVQPLMALKLAKSQENSRLQQVKVIQSPPKELVGYNSNSVAIFIRLTVVASHICEIPRNFTKIRTYSSSSPQGHPRSLILVSIESAYATSYQSLQPNSNFGRISYSFRDSSQTVASNRQDACLSLTMHHGLPTSVPSTVSCTYYDIDAFIFKIACFPHPTLVRRRLAFQYQHSLQCESKKIPPLRFSEIFSQTAGNF